MVRDRNNATSFSRETKQKEVHFWWSLPRLVFHDRSSLERGIKGPVSTVSVVNSFSDPTRGRNSQFDNYNPMAIEAKHYKRIMFPETTH